MARFDVVAVKVVGLIIRIESDCSTPQVGVAATDSLLRAAGLKFGDAHREAMQALHRAHMWSIDMIATATKPSKESWV
jgi:hypothetical protein